MLTQDNLADLLNTLGFEKKGAIHRKEFGAAILEVNFTKKEITYPETAGLTINERQTCNFDANENFVVLECVHRLLEKGYKPADQGQRWPPSADHRMQNGGNRVQARMEQDPARR